MHMTELNENPVMLILDTAVKDDADALPVRVLETRVSSEGKPYFVELPFDVRTPDAQRFVIDHITNTREAKEGSSVANKAESLKTAVGALQERIHAISGYLMAVQSGKVKGSAPLLRKISALCNMLPVGTSEELSASLLGQKNDAMLLTYLSQITKVALSVDNVTGKVNELSSSRNSAVDAVGSFGFEFSAQQRRSRRDGAASASRLTFR